MLLRRHPFLSSTAAVMLLATVAVLTAMACAQPPSADKLPADRQGAGLADKEKVPSAQAAPSTKEPSAATSSAETAAVPATEPLDVDLKIAASDILDLAMVRASQKAAPANAEQSRAAELAIMQRNAYLAATGQPPMSTDEEQAFRGQLLGQVTEHPVLSSWKMLSDEDRAIVVHGGTFSEEILTQLVEDSGIGRGESTREQAEATLRERPLAKWSWTDLVGLWRFEQRDGLGTPILTVAMRIEGLEDTDVGGALLTVFQASEVFANTDVEMACFKGKSRQTSIQWTSPENMPQPFHIDILEPLEITSDTQSILVRITPQGETEILGIPEASLITFERQLAAP